MKPATATKVQQLTAELLAICSQPGFHGSVQLVASVQDGHIQHLRLVTDRMHR